MSELSLAFREDNAPGDLLVTAVYSTERDCSLTDSNGNCWTKMSTERRWRWRWRWPFLIRYWENVFYATNCVGGKNTVSVSGVTGEVEIAISETGTPKENP